MAERLSKIDRLKRDIIELDVEDCGKILAWLEAVVAVREEDKARLARKTQLREGDIPL